MDSLTNECQQLAMEVFAQHGAPNNASTIAAARLVGEAFANRIREREGKRVTDEQKQPIGGNDFLSKEYASWQFRKILPGYEPSSRGVFEDIFSVLRQDGFMLRSLAMIGEAATKGDIEQIEKIRGTLKILTTWVTSFSQYTKEDKS